MKRSMGAGPGNSCRALKAEPLDQQTSLLCSRLLVGARSLLRRTSSQTLFPFRSVLQPDWLVQCLESTKVAPSSRPWLEHPPRSMAAIQLCSAATSSVRPSLTTSCKVTPRPLATPWACLTVPPSTNYYAALFSAHIFILFSHPAMAIL